MSQRGCGLCAFVVVFVRVHLSLEVHKEWKTTGMWKTSLGGLCKLVLRLEGRKRGVACG